MRHQESLRMNWTEERVEALKKYWAEGLSASQIAALLGGVSRNAVIGKVHRLKLSGRGRTPAAPARQKKPAQPQPIKAPAKPVTVSRPAPTGGEVAVVEREAGVAPVVVLPQPRSTDALTLPTSRMLDLTDLNERTCKWPIGDPLAPGFHFCGNETAETGPYCRYHARIAFQPPADRRRR
jgi:GcrA cell cycle regulator